MLMQSWAVRYHKISLELWNDALLIKGHETDVEVNCDVKCIQLPGAQESSEMVWKTSIRAELFHYNPYSNDLLALDQLSGGLITQMKAQWMHAHTFEYCSSLFFASFHFLFVFFFGLANELTIFSFHLGNLSGIKHLNTSVNKQRWHFTYNNYCLNFWAKASLSLLFAAFSIGFR